MSGTSCLNNTSIVVFAALQAERLEGSAKNIQGFQNLFFMGFKAFRENCDGGSVRFRTKMLKFLKSPRVEPKLHMKGGRGM